MGSPAARSSSPDEATDSATDSLDSRHPHSRDRVLADSMTTPALLRLDRVEDARQAGRPLSVGGVAVTVLELPLVDGDFARDGAAAAV